MKKQENKPLIESLINTAAMALTASGVVMLLDQIWFGFAMVSFAVGLEVVKYMGRRKYW